jgi:hypothetical protein
MSNRFSPEMVASLPAGTIVASRDRWLAWRKRSARKTDWEKLRPTAGGWEPTRPVEYGLRVFASMMRVARNESLFVFE